MRDSIGIDINHSEKFSDITGTMNSEHVHYKMNMFLPQQKKKMKRSFEVSDENKPKWDACVSFTISESLKEDPDMYVSKLYETCVHNFKTNNYPLDKAVRAKAKRVEHQKQKDARIQANQNIYLQPQNSYTQTQTTNPQLNTHIPQTQNFNM